MAKIDLLETGKEIIRQVHENISKIPSEHRGIIIKEREDDKTRLIDKVADDVVYEQLERASRSSGLGFLLLSEEQGKEPVEIGRGSNKVYAILDPVDGSWNAITNVPLYSSNLAFTEPTERDDITLKDFDIGIIGDLASGRIYFARKGGKAYQENGNIREVFTSKETDPRKSRLFLDSYSPKYRPVCEKAFLPLRLGFKDHGRLYGVGIETAMMLAPDEIIPGYVGFVSMDQKVDNIIASKIVLESAGGVTSDWERNPLDHYSMDSKPNVIFSANKGIYETILRLLDYEK